MYVCSCFTFLTQLFIDEINSFQCVFIKFISNHLKILKHQIKSLTFIFAMITEELMEAKISIAKS